MSRRDVDRLFSTQGSGVFEGIVAPVGGSGAGEGESPSVIADMRTFDMFGSEARGVYQAVMYMQYPRKPDGTPGDFLVDMSSRRSVMGDTTKVGEITDSSKLLDIANFIYEQGRTNVDYFQGWRNGISRIIQAVSENRSVPWGVGDDAMTALSNEYIKSINREPVIPEGHPVPHPCPHKGCGHKEVQSIFLQTRSLDEGATQFIQCCKCGENRDNMKKYLTGEKQDEQKKMRK